MKKFKKCILGTLLYLLFGIISILIMLYNEKLCNFIMYFLGWTTVARFINYLTK